MDDATNTLRGRVLLIPLSTGSHRMHRMTPNLDYQSSTSTFYILSVHTPFELPLQPFDPLYNWTSINDPQSVSYRPLFNYSTSPDSLIESPCSFNIYPQLHPLVHLYVYVHPKPASGSSSKGSSSLTKRLSTSPIS